MAEHSAMAIPPFERFDGAEAWAQLPAELKDEIGTIALELAAAHSLADRVSEDGLPDTFDRIANAANAELRRDLYSLVTHALPSDSFVASDGRSPRIPALLGGVCRICACSQNDACPEGCGWAADDLCTACAHSSSSHPTETSL